MKLQYLIIIFLAIMLPIVLVLSQYIGIQIDTIALKNKYDAALLGSTFDMMAALEINTRNVSNSDAIGEEIRELEAVINTFSNSLASSLGITGTATDYILSRVPALVFCLYDGYYLYTPTSDSNDQKLKPYVYYTKTYKNGTDTDITIAYSLDNYVSIYGTYSGNKISESGYLIVCDNDKGVSVSNDFAYVSNLDSSNNVKYDVIQGTITYKGTEITKETLFENKPSKEVPGTIDVNQKEETTDAMVYYYEAYRFTQIYNKAISSLKTEDKNKLLINTNNDPESSTSKFMDEKIDIIKETLTKGIEEAIYQYKGGTSGEFEIPQLTGEDWDKILNDISIISFMMDVPLNNMKSYNKYVIVNSTTNQKYISPKSIDFIGYNTNNDSLGFYHKITCRDLVNDIQNGTISNIIGYASVDFERYKMEYENNNGITSYAYYYKHREYAGYECEVGSIEKVNVAEIEQYLTKNFPNLDQNARKLILKSYYSAVGRIRIRLTKASSYIRMSNSYSMVFGDNNTKKCKVHFDSNNGYFSGTASTNSNYGRVNIQTAYPTKAGQSFIGWKSTASTSTGITIKPNSILYYNEIGNGNGGILDINLRAEYTASN